MIIRWVFFVRNLYEIKIITKIRGVVYLQNAQKKLCKVAAIYCSRSRSSCTLVWYTEVTDSRTRRLIHRLAKQPRYRVSFIDPRHKMRVLTPCKVCGTSRQSAQSSLFKSVKFWMPSHFSEYIIVTPTVKATMFTSVARMCQEKLSWQPRNAWCNYFTSQTWLGPIMVWSY